MPNGDQRWRGKMTPIPEPLLKDFDASITHIRADLKEMKPQIKETHDGFIVLKTEMGHMIGRVDSLEGKTADLSRHECAQVNTISQIETCVRDSSVAVAQYQGKASAVYETVNELKESRSKIIYWFLGLAAFVLTGIIGWVVLMATLQTDVRHINQTLKDLKTEQKIIFQRVQQ